MIKTTYIAVKNGVTVVQLRSEHPFSGREWYDMTIQLKQVLTDTTVPLIINDKVDIALAVGADGVHEEQNDLAVQKVRRLIGPNKFLGLSVNNNLQMTSTLPQMSLCGAIHLAKNYLYQALLEADTLGIGPTHHFLINK